MRACTFVFQVLSLEKDAVSDQPSSVQVRHRSSSFVPNVQSSSVPKNTSNSHTTSKPSNSGVTPKPPSQIPSVPEPLKPVPEHKPLAGPASNSTPSEESPVRLAETGRSSSNLAISGSQLNLINNKEPTPSIASDISNPFATQELQHRMQQLQK